MSWICNCKPDCPSPCTSLRLNTHSTYDIWPLVSAPASAALHLDRTSVHNLVWLKSWTTSTICSNVSKHLSWALSLWPSICSYIQITTIHWLNAGWEPESLKLWWSHDVDGIVFFSQAFGGWDMSSHIVLSHFFYIWPDPVPTLTLHGPICP